MVSVAKLADTLLAMVDEREDASAAVDTFFAFLEDRGLAYLAPDICKILEEREAQRERLEGAQITTARTISEDLKENIADAVDASEATGSKVSMQTDPSLLGGFRVRVGNTLYDATLRRNLENLKKQLRSK